MHMFQHGLPRLLAPPARSATPPVADRNLTQALAETTDWLMALVYAMNKHDQQPELAHQ